MTAAHVSHILDGKIVCAGESGADASSVYAGDFLSRVMGKAPQNSIWLTVMGNVNVAGVAVLADIKIVVLCEGAEPDKLLTEKLQNENIALICTQKSVYECCKLL